MHADDFRDDLPPSRGQWQAIARHALDLLGIEQPESRAGATEALVRLKASTDLADRDRAGTSGDPVTG